MSYLADIKHIFSGISFKSKYEKRFVVEWGVTTIITLLFLGLFVSWPLVLTAGNLIYDRLEALREVKPSNQIAIIALDDKSIDALGGWPLSRLHYAKMLQKLADTNNQPKRIAFDLLFLDETTADSELAKQMQRHQVVLPLEFRYRPDAYRRQAILPTQAIQTANPQYGHIQISYDADGLIRGSRVYEEGARHFALALWGREVHLNNPYQRFPMVDPKVGFKTYALSDVLSDRFNAALLKDKYVLVGAMAASLGDRYPTIYSGVSDAGSPGVEINASLLNALMNGDLISQANTWQIYLFSGICLLIVLLGLLTLSPAGEIALTLAVMLIMLLLSGLILRFGNVWLNPVPGLLVIALVKPIWAWRRMEMINHFMRDKSEDLKRLDGDHALPTKEYQQSSRSSFVQYTQMLTEAIQSANERLNFLALVISEIPEAVLIADESGRVMRFNQKMEAIFAASDLHQQSMTHLFDKLTVFSQEKVDELMSRLYSEERFAAMDKHGVMREFRMRVLPLPVSAVSHWRLMMMVDITDLVNLQKQRDRTLAILTHDMRTPVASILAVCRNASENTVNLVSNVQKHSHFLLALMDDFILSIRAESDKYRIEETLVETLLDEAIYQVKELMQNRTMTIHYQPSEPVFLAVDGRLMTRVIVNLLANAIRYGASGTQVAIETSVVNEQTAAPTLTIAISNLVGGADDVKLSAPEHKGFGMGLDFIQTVVKKHDGQFRQFIPAEQGMAARVEIDLPCTLLH